jgi:MFS family permease
LSAVFIDETGQKSTEKKERIPYRQVVFTRIIFLPSMICFVGAVFNSGMSIFLPVFLKSMPDLNVGVFFMFSFGTMVVVRLFGSHLSDRYGRGPVVFISFCFVLLSLLLVTEIDSKGMMIVVAITNGLGSSLYFSTLSALVADNAAPAVRGSAFGFMYSAFDVGMILAGVILGFIADMFGLSTMFYLSAGFGAIILMIFTFNIRPGISKSIAWTLAGKNM